jgi:hypothetical protein
MPVPGPVGSWDWLKGFHQPFDPEVLEGRKMP